MSKDRIRDYTASYLSGLGYDANQFSWPKRGRLQIDLVGEYRLVAGISRKALTAALAGIPRPAQNHGALH